MRSPIWKTARFTAPLALAGLCACLSPPVAVPRTAVTQETQIREQLPFKDKVDILFMIDNSPSMAPKQAELKRRFPQLIKVLDAFAKPVEQGGMGSPARYHIGVVTSDLGAGMFTLGVSPQQPLGQCHPNGDGAKLQAIGRAGVLPDGTPCGMLGPDPDTNHAANYIVYDQKNNTSNLPTNGGKPQSLADTFNCMASVGDSGCGFEYQLEAVFDALRGTDELGMPIPDNQGFLRDDAILAVIWVTDEDDCSAPIDTTLFDPGRADLGPLLSYRCTNYSILCGNPPALTPMSASNGALPMCGPADAAHGDKLYDSDRFVSFFTLPKSMGGVKTDPNDVVLASISAPPDPVEIILANPNPQPPGPYQNCSGPVDGKSCAVVLQHSCVLPSNLQFFGDPAVRIAAVVSSIDKVAHPGGMKHSQVTSICDPTYEQAIQGIGQLIVHQIGNGCLDSALAKNDQGQIDCVVEDHIDEADGKTPIVEIPPCPAGTQEGDTVAKACWIVVTNVSCPPIKDPGGGADQQIGVRIFRPTSGAPARTTTTINCATIPQ